MVDQVNNASDVLNALEAAFNNDTNTSDVTTKVMGEVNKNPNVAASGWIGLYVDHATLRPRTIGSGSGNWQFNPTFKIIVQASDQTNSKNAYAKLEALITKVVNVVLANPVLNGFVEGSVVAIDIDYQGHEDDKASLHFEGAVLSVGYQSASRR